MTTTAIWGIILFKVITAFWGKDDVPLPKTQPLPMQAISVTPDVYSLNGSYPDPFLWQAEEDSLDVEKNKQSSNTLNLNGSGEPTSNPLQQTQITPPDIKFMGFIKNSKSKKKMAIIIYNGSSITVRENDKVENFYVQRITENTIEIRYMNKRFSFGRN